MSLTRRHVIQLGQALLASAIAPLTVVGSEPSGAAGIDNGGPAVFTKTLFQPLVNSSFNVRRSSGEQLWFTLMSVEDTATLQRSAAAERPRTATIAQVTDSFALQFYCVDETLGQDTYHFEHSATGGFDMFVVPSGRSRYTAIINHLAGYVPGMEVPVRQKRSPSAEATESRAR